MTFFRALAVLARLRSPFARVETKRRVNQRDLCLLSLSATVAVVVHKGIGNVEARLNVSNASITGTDISRTEAAIVVAVGAGAGTGV